LLIPIIGCGRIENQTTRGGRRQGQREPDRPHRRTGEARPAQGEGARPAAPRGGAAPRPEAGACGHAVEGVISEPLLTSSASQIFLPPQPTSTRPHTSQLTEGACPIELTLVMR